MHVRIGLLSLIIIAIYTTPLNFEKCNVKNIATKFKNKPQEIKRVILDVDVGIDDSFALIYLIYAEKIGIVKLEAVNCAFGNTEVDNSCRNVVRLLEIMGRTDIPVYRGATNQLIVPPNYETSTYYGVDGFGDLHYTKEPNMSIVRKEPAALAMRDIVVANPKQITLVCVAPLTNLALAIKLYDDFLPNLRELHIMGGNYKGIGNTQYAAEFNFYTDPEAAYIALRNLTFHTTILPLEAGLAAGQKLDLDWRFKVLGQVNTPVIKLLNSAERNVHRQQSLQNSWHPFDAFLAIAFVFPDEMIVKSFKYPVTVELAGVFTRGEMILYREGNYSVTIIEDINVDFFKRTILEATQCIG